ncbi:hypothetical protein D3C71_1247210 [compost metagenome]
MAVAVSLPRSSGLQVLPPLPSVHALSPASASMRPSTVNSCCGGVLPGSAGKVPVATEFRLSAEAIPPNANNVMATNRRKPSVKRCLRMTGVLAASLDMGWTPKRKQI